MFSFRLRFSNSLSLAATELSCLAGGLVKETNSGLGLLFLSSSDSMEKGDLNGFVGSCCRTN